MPSGGTLGGGSSINFMMYTRCQGIDMDAWKTRGWTAREMRPIFNKLETFHQDEQGIDKNKHGYDGPIHISSGGFRSRSSDAFIDTVKQMGFDEIVDLQDLDQVGGFSVRPTESNFILTHKCLALATICFAEWQAPGRCSLLHPPTLARRKAPKSTYFSQLASPTCRFRSATVSTASNRS